MASDHERFDGDAGVMLDASRRARELALDDTQSGGAEMLWSTTAPADGRQTSDEISTTYTDNPAQRRVTSQYAALRPGMVIGQYELIRALAQGGMGAVYLARDARLGRRVAIKFLAQEKRALAGRFLAEARATARCRHENIVVIHDAGEAHGHSYMVLEHLEGVTLRAWLTERWLPGPPADADSAASGQQSAQVARPVSPSLAVELVVPVVRALEHAHRLGLVHRDLKPENVMLTDNGAVKVLDFGIAKALEHAMTVSRQDLPRTLSSGRAFETLEGALVGTLPYMSPEQWGADEVDVRSDLWAVGIMLWELCTGQHPLEPLSKDRLMSVYNLKTPMPSMAQARPDLGPLAHIIDSCLRKRKHERMPSATILLEQLERLRHARDVQRPAGAGEPDNPYAGLAAFQTTDAGRFFGRERDIASLTAQLRNQRMITVAGASGAGKSSLVRAGVIPALERSGAAWRSFIIRPGRYPLAALAGVLAQVAPDDDPAEPAAEPTPDAEPHTHLPRLIDTLRAQPGHLGAALRVHAHEHDARVLLFVDQLEELYTLGADRDTRAAFVRCLEAVADDASSPLRVLACLRSDFLDRVAEDREFASELTRTLVLLPSMDRDGLCHALIRPLEATGHAFENQALVTTMLDALEATRSPLPLLQFTAAKLWLARDRERRLLTHESYRELGGVAGALAVHADATLAGLSAREQRLARAIFTSLVSEDRTRAMVSLAELRALGSQPDAIEDVVQELAGARLLLVETGGEDGSLVELAHESLIDRWPRLRQWLDEDQEEGRFRAGLRAAAREWDKQGRSEDLLWRGQAADQGRRWLERSRAHPGADDTPAGAYWQDELGQRERDFLEAVVDLATRARRRRRRLAVGAFTFISTIALVVSVLAVHAMHETDRAERLAAKAARQTEEIAAYAERAASESVQARNASRMASAREYQSDPTLALALVRELEPTQELPKRWDDLARWAMYRGVSEAVLPHADVVASVAFSPDNTRMVTASLDRLVRVFRADATGEPLAVLTGHDDFVYAAAFSPDGARIASASADRTVRIWNADGSGRPLVLTGHTDVVYAVAFSPDGTHIVSASRDRTARIFRADGSGTPIVLAGHSDWVYTAAFSPDGARVVTASWDKTSRIWNADGSGAPVILRGHQDRVYAAAFSPDSTHVVTGSRDQTVRIFRADGTGTPIVLTGHQDIIYAAAFSPDGRRIATASKDKTVRLWNADGSGRPLVLEGHQARVYSVAFDPEGARLASASADKTVRLWDARGTDQPVVLEGHDDLIYSALFSPDGLRAVTASWDRTARIWNTDGTGTPIILRGHQDVVYAAAFSPDGTRVVTASRDNTARVWSADGTGTPIILRGHADRVYSAGFDPSGERVVTASKDRTARIWNTDGTGTPIVLTGHRDFVYSAAFSPDGTRVVTASWDGTARIWNADGTGTPIVLHGHQDRVHAAAFSPDGRHVVTASRDKTARLWNADGTGTPIVLTGHEAALGAGWKGGQGAFDHRGTHLITAAHDSTIRIWPMGDTANPWVLHVPDIGGPTAALAPAGTHIISASHTERIAATGELRHTAKIWPYLEPFTGPDDPRLWAATTYCPPIDLRIELLGLPEYLARQHLAHCRERVAAAHAPRQ